MANSLTTERAAAVTPLYASLRKAAIMPAYNEADQIAAVIAEIEATDPDICVIVIDDGSTDETAAIAARYDVTLVSTPNGKAASRSTRLLRVTPRRRSHPLGVRGVAWD